MCPHVCTAGRAVVKSNGLKKQALLTLGVKCMKVCDGLCKWSEGTGCENLMQFD